MDAGNNKKFYTHSKIEDWRKNIHRGQNIPNDDEPSISATNNSNTISSEMMDLYESMDSVSVIESSADRATKRMQQALIAHCERERSLDNFRRSRRSGSLLKDLINLIASHHPYGFEEKNLEDIMMASEEIRRMAKKIIATFDVDENKPPNGEYILWNLNGLIEIIKTCCVYSVSRKSSTVGFQPRKFDRKISTSIADRMIYQEDNFMNANEEIVFTADCYFHRLCLILNDARIIYGSQKPTINRLAQTLRADRVASSLLVKLFSLLDGSEELRRENKQTRVHQGYDAFTVLRLPYQYPESIAEGHEEMLLYLVTSPYASHLKEMAAYKDRSAQNIEEIAIVAPGLASTPQFIWEKITNETGPSLENFELETIATDQDQKLWREEKWKIFEEAKYRDEDGKTFFAKRSVGVPCQLSKNGCKNTEEHRRRILFDGIGND
ncbi:Oidioi.mRNA.OKI2018_I69.XSR.g13824.t1.cds [Oikopleura dioica]|uniref:Oidioi.mRNA.OKI2018_I69.XSR.g13824.t1.cds n=1 Tax=Oikopleura dioica TaxID=34765 RepID=A0ABN7S8G4_OIKDI|nr:Oidioi.mRNA.OKI2018_I69.XSR.g13824.t1.cds [Oikopleura dioica]